MSALIARPVLNVAEVALMYHCGMGLPQMLEGGGIMQTTTKRQNYRYIEQCGQCGDTVVNSDKP